MEGFLVDLDGAMRFYKLCARLRLETEEERLALMRRLVKKKQAKYIAHPEEFLEGKNVWTPKDIL